MGCEKVCSRNINLLAEHTGEAGNEKANLKLKQEKSRLQSW